MCFVENAVWLALGGSFDEVRCYGCPGGKLPLLTLSFLCLPSQPAAPLPRNTKDISELQVKRLDKLSDYKLYDYKLYDDSWGILASSQGCFTGLEAPSVC